MTLLFLFNHNVSDIFHTRDYYKKISQRFGFDEYANICKSYPMNYINFSFRNDVNFRSFHSAIIIFASSN